MDRFIVSFNTKAYSSFVVFKIQYGQIYSDVVVEAAFLNLAFKIQYGQIYSGAGGELKYLLPKFKIQYGQIYSFQSADDIYKEFV